MARLARRAVARCAPRIASSRVRGDRRRARSTTSCCSAWAGRASRPRCCGRTFDGRVVPRARHDASGRDPAPRGRARPRADALPRRLQVGIDARDALHLEYFWERSGGRGERFAAITDPGSELERARERARLPRDLRRRAGDRRALLGALAVRDGPGRADGRRPRAVPRAGARRWSTRAASTTATRGSSSGCALGEGWREGRDKVCLDRHAGGFGLWVEQLLAESTGKEGKGLVPAPGEAPTAPDRQARRGAASSDPYELGAGVLPLGVRDRGRRARSSGSTRSTSPTSRRRRTRRTRCSPRGEPDVSSRVGSVDELLAQARERRLHRDPGVHRPGARGGSSSRSPSARARPAASSPSASGRATCTRRASCTRAARTPASSSRSSTRPVRSCRFPAALRLRPPDPRAGGRRLRSARGARPPRRRVRLEDCDEARNGRPRPDGRRT